MQREQHPSPGFDRAPPPDLGASRTRQFRIAVPQSALDDLEQRLARTRWSPDPKRDWSRGTSRSYLHALVDHWITTYDWRVHEAALNELPQFTADVGGETLHFVHARARAPHAMPLLLLHGWPDSFYRYHAVVEQLTNPSDGGDAFDLVIPSLPGFAFTGPLRHPREQAMRHAADLLYELVTGVLGYERFAVAGGDGGSVLAQILAIDHPESVIGIHLTDLGWHAIDVDPKSLSRGERKYLAKAKQRFMKDGAYAMVQSTRPRSLAPGLADSPTGLASWILDRFHSWSSGDLDASFGKDTLLTNIMLYWITNTIDSSVLGYFTETKSPSLTSADHVDRPTAVALFPYDIGGVPPRSFAERTLNVQRWTEMPRGGHFAALEEPALYATEVTAFFRSLRAHHREDA